MPTVGYSIAVSQMRVFLHPSTSMFQCNNLLVSYIPAISKLFHLIVTIIKHINVFQNIYMQQLFLLTAVDTVCCVLSTVHVYLEEMSVL